MLRGGKITSVRGVSVFISETLILMQTGSELDQKYLPNQSFPPFDMQVSFLKA